MTGSTKCGIRAHQLTLHCRDRRGKRVQRGQDFGRGWSRARHIPSLTESSRPRQELASSSRTRASPVSSGASAMRGRYMKSRAKNAVSCGEVVIVKAVESSC